MQTIPLDSKHGNKALRQPPPQTKIPSEPFAGPLGGHLGAPATSAGAQSSTGNRERAQQDMMSELDATLARDPNTGAVHGVGFALMFNAGLALSGVVLWELWMMLAH